MKLGIIGSGMIVREFLPDIIALPDCTVKGICGTRRSKEKTEKLAREHGIPKAFTSFEALLEEAIDTVYVAVPNTLHYQYTRAALEAGKNVIVEKPMAGNTREAQALAALAREKHLFLFEAITTLYLQNYQMIRRLLSKIEPVKMVLCNFSQYSSRYDAFLKGDIKPAFDPKAAGGALMDLGVYNVHFVMGIFGKPESVTYAANIQRDIDTSGIMTMDYPDFKVVSIAAKDCGAPGGYQIEGSKGYLSMDKPSNSCGPVKLHLNDGTEEIFDVQPRECRVIPEFKAFIDRINRRDFEACYQTLDHSVAVCQVLTEARRQAGIVFPGDLEK